MKDKSKEKLREIPRVPPKDREKLYEGFDGIDGFVDWNRYSMDQLANYLERKWEFHSSGEALAIMKMVKFYRENSKEKNKK